EQVAFVDVGKLVAEDGGELGLVLEATQEPGVNKDATVGHGERIQRRIAENAEPDDRAARPRIDRAELCREPAEILLEPRIFIGHHAREKRLLLALGLAPELNLLGRRRERRVFRADGWYGLRTGSGEERHQQRRGQSARACPHVSSARRAADEPAEAAGVPYRCLRPSGSG